MPHHDGQAPRIRLAWPLAIISSLCLLFTSIATADVMVEMPVLAAFGGNDRGVFEVMLFHWDQKSTPDPVVLQLREAGVRLRQGNVDSLVVAFRYAVTRTPSVPHTGTVTVQGYTYVPVATDGPSAGAAMTVGLIALFKGDSIRRGMAITGTVHPDGTIGPVGSIPDKVRAAAREGCRTILIPAGQLQDGRWNLIRLGFELNVEIKEVGTIDEAYELLTGQRIL